MPSVQRIVQAGLVREVKNMFTTRVHTKGAVRGLREKVTSEAQAKANMRRLIDATRWKLNANFRHGDLHTVFRHYGNISLEEADSCLRKVLRLLRTWFREKGVKWKYAAVTEVKGKAGVNIHHHIILPDIPMAVMNRLWESVVGKGGGNVTATMLDRRGNHGKLAVYLFKYSVEADRMWKEMGKRRHKRISWAQGMETPRPQYIIKPSNMWAKEPRPHKGWILLKDDDGEAVRSGIDESGWPYQEYFELWVGDGKPPAAAKNRPGSLYELYMRRGL